jgi:hypothetical protein
VLRGPFAWRPAISAIEPPVALAGFRAEGPRTPPDLNRRAAELVEFHATEKGSRAADRAGDSRRPGRLIEQEGELWRFCI